MKFDIGAIFGQLLSFYTRLPLAQKVALPLLLALSVGAIVFVSRWAGRPEYQVLFSNLEEADAASVVERLRDMKIGYRLREDGRTIEVTPPSVVHETRLDLAAAGLPKGGNVGFELFDETKLGVTAVLERLNIRRASQGELERTIGAIDSIKSVRVHITEPERSAFVKRDTLPTASVLLRLKAGAELTPAQVKGIANLVAGSVERLTPENVSIMDSKGNMLNEKKDGSALNGADVDRLEYQRQIETALVKRVESMIGEIVGPGRAIARVTADIDFNKFEKEEESYDPSGTVTRSERSVEESSGADVTGGVPGVVSNLTNDPGLLAAPNSGKGSGGRKESVKNFEVSRAVSRTASAAGKILRLSVAVLVDGEYTDIPSDELGPDGAPLMKKQYKALPGETLRKIDNLVKQSVGFDQSRGDLVTVENMKFAEPASAIEAALDKIESSDSTRWYMSFLLPGLFILLFFFLLVRPLIRFLVTPTGAEVDLSRLLPSGMSELEAELDSERSKLAAIPEITGSGVDIEELEALLAENSRLVRENPQQAALLIRYWLNDGRL